MRLSDNRQRTLVRVAHLLPPISSLLLLVLAAIPHFFYQSGMGTSATMGLFQILNISFGESTAYFGTTMAESSVADFYFYVWLLSTCILSWVCIFFYTIYSLITTVLSVFVVWSPDTHPTKSANLFKRVYRVLVPNRGFYIFYNLLPIFPSFFPLLLQAFYRSCLGENATLHYFGIPDPIITLLLSAMCIVLYLVSLKAQKRCRMDLFRIYKAED